MGAYFSRSQERGPRDSTRNQPRESAAAQRSQLISLGSQTAHPTFDSQACSTVSVGRPRGEGTGRRFHGTLLTPRQWEVLRYRSQGLTQSEVARRLDVTRENVCIIEHRAWLKIEEARATLAGLQEMATNSEVVIPSGASIYNAVAELLQRADLLGVKLHSSCDDLIAILKSRCRGKIRGHHLISALRIEITSDGSVSFKTST